jgi:mRNA-degrading endonuclease RelE of RelBE toxin-antitoxin system
MMRYTVVWLKSADDELVELWLSASDRSAITAATLEVDRQLAVDASSKGEPLSEGLRAFSIPPLRVIFAVNEDDRLVEVAIVRAI